jgi:hypothetical protein
VVPVQATPVVAARRPAPPRVPFGQVRRCPRSEEITLLAPQGTAVIIDDADRFPFAERPDAYLSALHD